MLAIEVHIPPDGASTRINAELLDTMSANADGSAHMQGPGYTIDAIEAPSDIVTQVEAVIATTGHEGTTVVQNDDGTYTFVQA